MIKLGDLMKQVKGDGDDVGPVLLPPTMDFVFKGLFGNGFPGVRGIARTYPQLLGLRKSRNC